MKKIIYVFIAALLTFTLSCKKDKKETETADDPAVESTQSKEDDKSAATEINKLTVSLEPRSDSGVSGNVVFRQDDKGVTMVAVLSGLTEGSHAIHLHETADCSAPDGTSTGGHWNPTRKQHGRWGDKAGYHKGDIGNFTADANGHGTITFVTNEWCIGCGDTTKDILGKAIIVHQGEDDYTTQPTGAAGGRVSCGGIIQ